MLLTNNSETSFLNLPQLSKNEKREIWLKRKEITLETLANLVGVKVSGLSKNLRNKTMPVEQHAVLVDFGLPPEILPAPQDQKRGPKPRNTQMQA